MGPDINLSIQFVLNCGSDTAGSCHGGSATGAYEFIKKFGFIPFDTCQPYIACSEDSQEGFCPFVDSTCKPSNVCRTCTNPNSGGECVDVSFSEQVSSFHLCFCIGQQCSLDFNLPHKALHGMFTLFCLIHSLSIFAIISDHRS